MSLLNRWDPFSEIARLQDQMARTWPGEQRVASFTPAVDIYEDKEAIFLKAELPGLKAEEVDVRVENNILTLTGERKLEKNEDRAGYHRIERTYGSFYRTVPLPEGVKPELAKATMHDGVLEISMPLAKVEEKTRKLEITEPTPVTTTKAA